METYNIKEMQAVQLDMLKEILKVAKNNNINIFLAYGTALGAIRHHGFIPWDDDVDLYIFQKDRERFQEACQRELPQNYFYQTPNTDSEYRLAIDRIRRSDTTLIEKEEEGRNINHGIFVDIYPLYAKSDNWLGYQLQLMSSFLYRLFLYGEKPKNKGKCVTYLASVVLKITPTRIKKKILKNNSMYIQEHGGIHEVTDFYGGLEKIPYQVEWFAKPRMVKFEDTEAPIAVEEERMLALVYGDYMKLPPKEKRVVHHDYVKVDCKRSYKEYMG